MDCEVSVDGTQLEYVSEFKYLGCVLDTCRYEAECRRKVGSGRMLQVLLSLWLMLGVYSLSMLGF